jgi:hypothetical protein
MSNLFNDLVREGRFVPTTTVQRFGYGLGALLLLSGLFHAGVFLVDGGGWDGPVSWRKPVVFGLSFGIFLITVTWLMGFLRPRAVTGWLVVGILGLASLGEVSLITMQTWRGVASHFNEATTFDETVFSWMGMLVAIIVVMTLIVTVWAFVRLDAPPSLALAIRLGLVLMLVSQGVGAQMIAEGGHTFGTDGALKVPHAFTLHAAQVLPALALLLLVSESTERRRLRVVALGAVGYGFVVASTMLQTYSGRAPLDLALGSTALAAVGLALLAACAVLAVLGLVTRTGPPPATPVVQGGTP